MVVPSCQSQILTDLTIHKSSPLEVMHVQYTASHVAVSKCSWIHANRGDSSNA